MRRVPISTLFIGGLLVALLLLYVVTFKVRFYETAIKVHLGRSDESSVISQPGIQFRWPPPVDVVYVYDRRLQTLDLSEAEVKTLDQKNVVVGAYAIWRIDDPLKFHIRVRSVGEADAKIRERLNQIRAAVIGSTDMSSFVNLDQDTVNNTYNRVQHDILAAAEPILKSEFGIELKEVNLRRISLPENANTKIFEAQMQERESLAARYRGEGQSKADQIRADAEANSRQIMLFAEVLAQNVRSEGYKHATPTLAKIQTKEDREFFLWLRTLDAIRAALKERTTIFLDSTSPFYPALTSPDVKLFDLDKAVNGATQPGGKP